MVDADTSDVMLFGDPIDDTDEPGTQEDPKPLKDPDEPVPDQNEEEKKRFQYWQSIADKERNRAAELEFAAPIAQLLKEKPELLLKLQADLVNSGKPEEVGPKRPEEPVIPQDYDEVAAFNDPASESFKYRKSVEAYNKRMILYMEERDKQRAEIFKRELDRREMEEQERLRIAKLKTVLVQKGLTAVEAEDFVQTMNSPESFTADNLIALYKLRKSSKVKTNKETEIQERANRRELPIPDAAGGVSRKPELVDKDKAMTGAFLKAAKGK